MSKWSALLIACSVLCVSPAGSPRAQQPSVKSAGLTAQDYIDIKQLVVRSAYAMDSGEDRGYRYADLFTGDGEVAQPHARGREQLAALARGGPRGPAYASRFIVNHVIVPSAEGAIGRAYTVEVNFDDDPPSRHLNGRTEWEMVGVPGGRLSQTGGRYEDVYVRTAEGWRIKKRAFIASKSGRPSREATRAADVLPAAAPAPRAAVASRTGARASALTPLDYIQIEQLVANYGYALDTNADAGGAYALNFTPDGTVFRRITGYEAMTALANKQVYGPHFVRHFLANMLIEPSPGGATGKNYLMVLDMGENGRPSSIYIGGHYEDTYTKTAEGWRFQTRTLVYSQSGPQVDAGASR